MMGVMPSKHFDDGYTPTCDRCGIALCWDISEYEYEEDQEFWDNWVCKNCNPKYKHNKKKDVNNV